MNKTEIKQYIISRFQEEYPDYVNYKPTMIDIGFFKNVNGTMSILHVFIDVHDDNPIHAVISMYYHYGSEMFPGKKYRFYPEQNGFRKEEVNE